MDRDGSRRGDEDDASPPLDPRLHKDCQKITHNFENETKMTKITPHPFPPKISGSTHVNGSLSTHHYGLMSYIVWQPFYQSEVLLWWKFILSSATCVLCMIRPLYSVLPSCICVQHLIVWLIMRKWLHRLIHQAWVKHKETIEPQSMDNQTTRNNDSQR